MAFIAAPASRLPLAAPRARALDGARAPRPAAGGRRRHARMQADDEAPAAPRGPTDAGAGGENVAAIPGSLTLACDQAAGAISDALAAGNRRLFVELDLTNGDETYTALKSSLPALRDLLPRLAPHGRVRVLFPDAGTAALTRRDWVADAAATVAGIGGGVGVVVASGAPADTGKDGREEKEVKSGVDWTDESRFLFSSMEDGAPDTRGGAGEGDDAMVVVVVPRASETEALQRVVEATSVETPIVVMNPDLVDMGVTGLSLNARRLQESLISAFSTAYYLRVFPWGVLLRAWPGRWGVWVDEPGSAVGFRLVAARDARPGTETLSDLLDEDARAAGQTPGGGGIGGMLAGFKRFVDVYMKG